MLPKYSDRKRIGILRRVEDNQNRENVASAISVPPNSNNQKSIGIAADAVHKQLSAERHSPRPSQQGQSTTSVAQELDLKAPASMKLKSTLLPPNELKPLNQKENGTGAIDQNHMSFWLRPTPVQPYPYNFIMAVRKKLEAITHPAVNRGKASKADAKNMKTPSGRPSQTYETRYKTNLALSKNIEENVYAGAFWSHIHEQNNRKGSSFYPSAMTDDINSNFFSSFEAQRSNVSMQIDNKLLTPARMAATNPTTVTTNESDGSQNTLSISSGILSHSSPEKKKPFARNRVDTQMESQFLLSPLSTDAVDGMHITLKNAETLPDKHQQHRKHIDSHIKFARGVDIQVNHQQDQPLDIQKMLNDFNESLSQVIQVNKKLHSALSIPSTQPLNTASSMSYSDDFDDENKETEKKSHEQTNDITYTSQFTEYRSDKTRSATQKTAQSAIQTVSEQIINNSSVTNRSSNDSTLQNTQMSKSNNATLQKSSVGSTNQEQLTGSIATQKNDYNLENRKSDGTNDDNLTSIQSATDTVAEEVPTATDNSDASNSSKDQIHERMIKSYEQRFSSDGEVLNTSIGSDMLAVFNRTSMEISNEHHNSTTWSEGNISYSSLGMVGYAL